MPMSEDKPSRQKFKWTKELVHIALNDGMTQEEISKVCRTQQSVVSSWKNGKNKATEQQLAELLRQITSIVNAPRDLLQRLRASLQAIVLAAREVAFIVNDSVSLAKRLGAAGRDRVKDLRWEQVVETLLGGAPR